jgi:hypothetical protein
MRDNVVPGAGLSLGACRLRIREKIDLDVDVIQLRPGAAQRG